MSLFQQGQKVKHKLGNQVMIVDHYEMQATGSFQRPRDPFFGRSATRAQPQNMQPTGRIMCGWVDKDNFPKKAFFEEHELELAE